MKYLRLKRSHSIIKDGLCHLFVFNAIFLLGMVLCVAQLSTADSYVLTASKQNTLELVVDDQSAPLCVSSQDYLGVLRVAGHLQTDIKKVTGVEPKMLTDKTAGNTLIIIGTIGKSPVIDKLIKEKKIHAEQVVNRWDTYALETVENPLPDVEKALVIFGSNKRGTIYGIYDLSSQIGVSPWYWWADVPVKKKENIYIKPGFYSPGEPKVRYRGIFINDERPCLAKWADEKFGGWNHQFYEKVFELLLRNRANYLWPAMWYGSEWQAPAFFDDDPENARLADEYGVVMSTSHHEPMMRAHHEWHRFRGGAWDYRRNTKKLQEFWRSGIERMGNYESVVTLGMRGDGDWDMPGGATVDLLKTIIADQRDIINEVTEKPADQTPQVWVIYKEVQDLYDGGLRPDDDIMILFCDDNWGNIKCLPKKEDLKRKGGFGVYYHFDYVGGPVSYKWANVTQIERVWEQMNLTYQRGARDLWIVNVGDIKPHELPMSFFMDYAWNPEAIGAGDLPHYYVNWAKQQFGDKYAKETGEILSLYTKYNARRVPEMLTANTYSVEHYREADRVLQDYKQLYHKAKNIYDKLPETHKSAYYQLVLFPVESCSNLNEMYIAAAKNKFYAGRGASQSANYYADKTKELFFKHDELHRYIHGELEDGKWNHMFDQPHIGHPRWCPPATNNMPPVVYSHTSGESSDLGFHVEYGTIYHWGGVSLDGIEYHYYKKLPQFDPANDQSYYIEIFNKGDETLGYALKAKQDWIRISKEQGTVKISEKVFVSIDWKKAPKGRESGEIILSGASQEYTIEVSIRNDLPKVSGFVENNGVVSIEAAHYENAVNTGEINWLTIPNLGRTDSSVTIAPANAERLEFAEKLELESGEYDVSIEAESGVLGNRWKAHSASGASNGKYIEIDSSFNNTGNSPESTSAENLVSYDFTISKDGNYKFWFRMYSGSGHDDSFFWRINDGGWILENGRYGVGSWFSTDSPQLDKLKKGKHVLQIAYRENGTRLDKFAFQRDNPVKWTGDSPHLEYPFTIFDAADVEVAAYLAPTYNFNRNEGLKFAVSIDEELPQVVNMHEGSGWWSKRVGDHTAIMTTKHTGLTSGQHTLKIWMVDAGVVFQKFVINAGGLKPSYLGPPESIYVKSSEN